MKTYTTLLFDADETLLDFGKTEEKALRRAFAAFGLPYEEDRTHALYHGINQRLWNEFSLGKTDKKTLTVQRFEELFAKLGCAADPVAFKAVYEAGIAEGTDVFPEAEPVLKTLKQQGYALYCVTNGLKNTQIPRLKGAGLLSYFGAVFLSEDAGAPKPQPAYFSYVLDGISETDRSRLLLIGDSLQTDIAGGNRAGIDTVWLDRENSGNRNPEIVPTYRIRCLSDLLPLLLQK